VDNGSEIARKANILIFIFIIMLVTSCSNRQIEPQENFRDGWIQVNDSIQIEGLIMVNDNIYVYTSYKVQDGINKNDVLGTITSIVDYLETPKENGQANFKIKGAKYAQYEDDIVVQIYDDWILFKNEKNMISGFSVSNFDSLMSELNEEEIFKVFRTIRKYIIIDENYEENFDSIIEKSFNECGIFDYEIINSAISNLKVNVTPPRK